jgi:hypothetical protein
MRGVRRLRSPALFGNGIPFDVAGKSEVVGDPNAKPFNAQRMGGSSSYGLLQTRFTA